LGFIVTNISDARVYFMCGHLGSFVGPQQVYRRSLNVFSIQPSVIVRWLQDHWHSVVNGRREFVWVGGDDAEALEPIFGRGVFPCLPASQSEGVGLLGLLIQPLPFIKAICGDYAAPAMKRNSPQGF
jgi:hypothetical protein